MPLLMGLNRLARYICLIAGILLLVCGSVAVLLQADDYQQDNYKHQVAISSRPTAVQLAEAKQSSDEMLREAQECPIPLAGKVLVRGKRSCYHWHEDCPVWRYHPIWRYLTPEKLKPARLMTRAAAETERRYPCRFCRELDKHR